MGQAVDRGCSAVDDTGLHLVRIARGHLGRWEDGSMPFMDLHGPSWTLIDGPSFSVVFLDFERI